MKIEFEIRKYAEEDLMLIRHETEEIPIKGLPSKTSRVIMMNQNEIPLLIETLNNYANQTRDT